MFRRIGTTHWDPGSQLSLANYAAGGEVMGRGWGATEKSKRPTKVYKKGGGVKAAVDEFVKEDQKDDAKVVKKVIAKVKTKKLKRGGSTGGKDWIKSAIGDKSHPEQRAAKKAGMSTHAFMEKNKDAPGKAGKRARLGLTLSSMSKGKK